PAPANVISRDWLMAVTEAAVSDEDPTNGGFGTAPKFPGHGTLAGLVARVARAGDERAREVLAKALDGMARGGMYDHLAGGFCRYSVDAEWRVPHFEKMLYDSAQLVPVYVDAWVLGLGEQHRRVARDTLAWMQREMLLDSGLFAASLDADDPTGAEGAFATWTPEELTALFGEQDGRRLASLFEVTLTGNFEHGRSVLRTDGPLEDWREADRELFARVRPAWLEARDSRPRPARDDKAIVAWNALAISAFARAGRALDDTSLVGVAARCAEVVLAQAVVDGRLHRTVKGGVARVPAFADDHANLCLALIDVYEATGEARWLVSAQRIADELVRLFWDAETGGLHLSGVDQPAPLHRTLCGIGSAEPGAGGVTSLAFVRLDRLCDRPDLGAVADRLVRQSQTWLQRAPRALGAEALAGAWLAQGGMEVAVVGDPAAEDTRALMAELRRRVLPFAVIAPPGTDAELPWLQGKEALGGRATAYVCEGRTCRLPVQDPEAFGRQLDERAAAEAPPSPPKHARVRAPELPDAPEAWIGTDVPLTLERLRGHVVIIDFWTYCCVNCQHVLPVLAEVERRYADQPVAVIGVHCAKFPTEELAENVRRAMQRHDVRHPVVHDPVHAIWEEYVVRSWPTVVVVDTEGRIALQQPGEIEADELCRVVDALLEEGRAEGRLAERAPLPHLPRDEGGDLRFPGKVHVWPDAFDQELGRDVWRIGRMYVADTGHHRILELSFHRGPDGWPVARHLRTFGSGDPGLEDGAPRIARFRDPQGLRRHGDRLYVADTGNHALRAVDLRDGTVTTLAGTGRKGRRAPSREALRHPTEVDLRSPWDVEVMAHRDTLLVFIAMAGNHQIWVYGVGHLGIFAGSGREDHVDGPAAASALAQPSGLALLGRYLLFADAETSSIRAVDLQSHQTLTVVGRGLFDFGDIDGPADRARLQHPLGMTIVGSEVIVADTFNHKLRAIALDSGQTRTVCGGPGTFAEPGGVARLDGYLVVADTNHHRLRVVETATGAIRDLPVSDDPA
ncbi:MAG: redoxin domain-containing protein, partial [Alphaproteobacteria bacterium]|nr:redoxin domain-containing protein [Alphaproteobacteria bacterium]